MSSSSSAVPRGSADSLASLKIAEIRRVFDLVDRDGSGSINASELGTVMKELAGAEPQPGEVAQLMKMVDTNNDGVVSWQEFLSALTEWLADDGERDGPAGTGALPEDGDRLPGRGLKRKEHPPGSPTHARARIHRRISTFFTQFSRASNFDDVRRRLAGLSGPVYGTDAGEHGPESLAEMQYDQQAKLLRTEECRRALAQLPDMAVAVGRSEPAVALQATETIVTALSIVEAYRTPLERYEVGDLILAVFRAVQEAAVVARVAKFLTATAFPELQYASLRLLTLYAPGPRIAHTPKDSVLHPDRMMHKTEVVTSGAVPVMVDLLLSPCAEVRDQACVCLGVIASHQVEARSFVLMHPNAFTYLHEQIGDATETRLLRKLTWTLSILCGRTHPLEQPPDINIVAPALPKFAYVLFNRDDEESLVNVLWALNHVLPGHQVPDLLLARLVALLEYPSIRVRLVILRTFSDLLRLRALPPTAGAGTALLPHARRILSGESDNSLRLQACDLVAEIVTAYGDVEALLATGMVPVLLGLLSDESLRWNAVRIFVFVTREAGDGLVADMVRRHDLVRAVSQSLQFFKSYDPVLREVYHFLGPSYNFDFCRDVLDVLDNVLARGERDPRTGFLEAFDMDVVDRVRSVLQTLAGELADQVELWRKSDPQHRVSLEERLRGLLERIRTSQVRFGVKGADVIARNISDILRDFSETLRKSQTSIKKQRSQRNHAFAGDAGADGVGSSASASVSASASAGSEARRMQTDDERQTVSVKLFFEGDNRTLDVRRDVTLADLNLKVQLKYGRPLVVQYEDEEGDKISIDSAELLARAFALFDKSGESTLRLHLLDRRRGAGGGGGGSGGAGSGADGSQAKDERLSKNELVSQLERHTHFSRRDLEVLYQQFSRTATNGKVTKPQFREGLKAIGITDEAMVDQFFSAFDYGKDGFVDFREFACGLSVMYKGSFDERMELAFKAYDANGDGVIDRAEMTRVLEGTFRAAWGVVDSEQVQAMVDKCFEQADANGDGTLDYEEFRNAVLRNQLALSTFWRASLA